MDWTCGSSSTVPAGNPEFNNPAQTYKKKKKKEGVIQITKEYSGEGI
jgi:hypothetical protein